MKVILTKNDIIDLIQEHVEAKFDLKVKPESIKINIDVAPHQQVYYIKNVEVEIFK
jgi:archaellum component FlaG (FlaF/FlaG flagellin family)